MATQFDTSQINASTGDLTRMDTEDIQVLDGADQDSVVIEDPVPSQNKARVSVVRTARTADIAEFEKLHLDAEKLSKAIFRDLRWQNALSFFKDSPDWDRDAAYQVLRAGARAFGLWHLDDSDLEGLANQLMESEVEAKSPALKRWMKVNNKAIAEHVMEQEMVLQTPAEHPQRVMMSKNTLDDRQIKTCLKAIEKEKLKHRSQWSMNAYGTALANTDEVQAAKWAISLIVFILSNAYAIKVVAQMYPGIIDLLGWPVYFARMGGMGAALWTGILYLTMSRNLLTQLSPHEKGSKWIKWTQVFFDAHKDLHIAAGKALAVTGIEHTVAHCIGTVPGILYSSLEDLNDLLGCANPETTPGIIPASFSFLQWPQCPIREKPQSFSEVLFATTPGLTGCSLLLMLGGLAYTAHQSKRTAQFETFWYFHNFLLVAWPITLFIHGSNCWIGVGFPLVVFTTSMFFIAYLWSRFFRFLRYFLYAGTHVKILECVIRPGKDHGPDGAMTYLRIQKPPPWIWRFRPGQYAFLCMPEYAPFQWHPFTICSGKHSETSDFLIAGIGDWTRELAGRCLTSLADGSPLPKIALDGPFSAPTQSALSKPILVAVGAGVGITPFLSLMSTIISMIANDAEKKLPLTEAHFYWSTRSADEFLFGRELFSRIAGDEWLKRKIFLHLHITAKEPDKNGFAYIFREAVRRQSAVDRKHFKPLADKFAASQTVHTGSNTPMGWLNGTTQDVLWVGHLLKQYDEIHGGAKETEISHSVSQSYEGHWGQSVFAAHALKSKKRGGSLLNPEKVIGDLLDNSKEEDWMLPVVFGRPDFGAEIRSIGKASPEHDVDIYICGNDAIVHGLQEVCIVCSEHAKRDYDNKLTQRKQCYTVHYERFG